MKNLVCGCIKHSHLCAVIFFSSVISINTSLQGTVDQNAFIECESTQTHAAPSAESIMQALAQTIKIPAPDNETLMDNLALWAGLEPTEINKALISLIIFNNKPCPNNVVPISQTTKTILTQLQAMAQEIKQSEARATNSIEHHEKKSWVEKKHILLLVALLLLIGLGTYIIIQRNQASDKKPQTALCDDVPPVDEQKKFFDDMRSSTDRQEERIQELQQAFARLSITTTNQLSSFNQARKDEIAALHSQITEEQAHRASANDALTTTITELDHHLFAPLEAATEQLAAQQSRISAIETSIESALAPQRDLALSIRQAADRPFNVNQLTTSLKVLGSFLGILTPVPAGQK